jgi:uncharacterized protein YjbI with pentapeptide repeats
MTNLPRIPCRAPLSLSLLPAVGFAGLTAAYLCGCGGGGTTPVATPPAQHGWGESQLRGENVRIGADSVVALSLEPKGATGEGDTGADGEDRIPYRLDRDTRLTVEMNPADPMTITLIASATGKLVFEMGPENPKVEMDLPAADYDLYVHSTSNENQTVFAKGEASPPTRANYQEVMLAFETGTCERCDLSRAGFYGMNLANANLAGANLGQSLFERCVLDGANLSNASLVGARFRNTEAKGANLTHANLDDTFFVEVNLSRANMTDARLFDASWLNVVADNSTTNGFRTMGTTLEGVDFSSSDMEWLMLWRCTVRKSNFSGARMDRSSLGESVVENSAFKGIRQNRAVWQDTVVKNADFTGANIGNTVFDGSFTDTKFTGTYAVYANYSGATLLRTSFVNADVQRATFAGGRDQGMNDFTGAILSNAVWFTGRTCVQGSVGLCR